VLQGVSLKAIGRAWNEREIRPRYAAKWIGGNIGHMLRRPRYADLRTYKGEIIGKATWPAIVDEDMWRAAFLILSAPGRQNNGNRGRAPKWLGCSAPRRPEADPVVLHAQIAVLRERMDEAARMHAEGLIDGRQLAESTASSRGRTAFLECQLAAAVAVSPVAGLLGTGDIRARWDAADIGLKRTILGASWS